MRQVRRRIESRTDFTANLPASSLPVAAADALLERYSLLGDFLPYKEYDDERKLVFVDGASGPAAVFGIGFAPFTIAGIDTENGLEELIKKSPTNSVLTFGQWCSGDLHHPLHAWANARASTHDVVLQNIALNRAAHFKRCVHGVSLISGEPMYPRLSKFMFFARVPFDGDPASAADIKEFERQVLQYQSSAVGVFKSLGTGGVHLMSEVEWKRLLRQMIHPSIDPQELDELQTAEMGFPEGVHESDTMVRASKGSVLFRSGATEKSVRVVPVTVDVYPDEMPIWRMGQIAGDAFAQTSRITSPFWLYTNIQVPDPEKIKGKVQIAYGMVSKQCMSDSAWFRSMVPQVFERRDETENFLSVLRERHDGVRMYTGMNVYVHTALADSEVEVALKTMRAAGFRASREPHITLPVFLASLPGVYNDALDQPNKGLRRASVVSSYNGACAAVVQGDWQGNSPWQNKRAGRIEYCGIPFVSRRGELAFFDLFNSETGYNAFIAARTGSGKSVLGNEILADILARGGIARVVDVGGSYEKVNRIFGGEIIRFKPNNPMSMNPYWGLDAEQDVEDHEQAEEDVMAAAADVEKGTVLSEMLPLLRDITVSMAYPTSTPDDYARMAIQDSIVGAFRKAGGQMGAKDVYEVMLEHDDQRIRDVALQMKPYAVGHLAPWFNGEPKITFKNRFTILELEELNADLDLRGVVLQLVIQYIERDMYRSARQVPKVMIVDEAWDLMQSSSTSGSGNSTKRFIETAFRRFRKYNASAVVIVQSLRDAAASPAAMAAFENSSWKVIMLQEAAAIQYAKEAGLIPNEPYDLDMISSIRRGNGFSEMAIVSQHGVHVVRFCLDPYSYYVYTSDAGDNARLEALEGEGLTVDEAVSVLAQQRIQELAGDARE